MEQHAGTHLLRADGNEFQVCFRGIGRDERRRHRDGGENAKWIVRRAGRAITVDDIWMSMPGLRRLHPDEINRNAVHEIGHAVVGIKLDVRKMVSVSIVEYVLINGSQRSLGQTRFESAPCSYRDRQRLLDEIAMLMGGIAAEEIVLGSFSDGAGGMQGSDLVTATDIATVLECQLGMGGTMTSEVADGTCE